MDRGQAERLLPMLVEMLDAADTRWADVRGIAVCTGPGNFTGSRLSVAAARGLALALGVRAIGVTVFEALAFGHPGRVRVMLQDRRGGIFAQTFRDGAALGPPAPFDGQARDSDGDTLHLGFGAREAAARRGGRAGAEVAAADPVVLARVAAVRMTGAPSARPTPFYLRTADAAPPSGPATVLLGDA